MNNKIILFTGLLLASDLTLAESLLDSAKQTVKTAETVNAVGSKTPATVQDMAVDAAKEKAKSAVPEAAAVVTEPGKSATAIVQDKVADTAKQKIEQATPAPVKAAVDDVKAGVDKAENLKAKVESAPKTSGEAVKAVKSHAKRKASKKALELLN